MILLALTISTPSFSQQIKSINKGESAPFTGYVIDSQFEKARRKEKELLINERNKNKVWQELGKIREGREEFYKKQAVEAKREAFKSDLQKVLYFVGGIILGGAAVYVGSKVSK